MEIQDRNSIMQLALNFNFDSKNISSANEMGFIDMIKANPVDKEIKVSKVDISKNNNVFINNSDKIENSNHKSEDVSSKPNKKSTTKVSDKKENTKSAQSANPVATEPTAKQTPSYDQTAPSTETSYIQSTTSATSADSEDVSETTYVLENEETVLSGNPLNLNNIFELAVAPAVQTTSNDVVADSTDLSSDIQVTQPVQRDVTTYEEVAPQINLTEQSDTNNIDINMDVNTDNTNNNKETEILKTTKTNEHVNTTDQPTNLVDDKDDLLIRQAQYFDKKIGSEHHVKINVNVNEAKIAEPIEKNILQNSFEITSMLQNNNIAELSTPVNEDISAEVTLQNDKLPQVDNQQNILQNNLVFLADAANSTTASVSEDAAIINPTQHIELSTQILAKNEAAPRLQELNNDTSLKGLGKEVIEQIKVNITKSAVKGVDTVDIELKPEDLGKIQVRMYIHKDGKLHAEIISSRQETSDLLQRELESLSKSFQDAGYDTDKQNFHFSSQEERQANRHNEESNLQQFIGETLEQEAEPIGVNDNLIYDPQKGLNIRV